MATNNNDEAQTPTTDYYSSLFSAHSRGLGSFDFTPVSQAVNNPTIAPNSYHPRPHSNNWIHEQPAQLHLTLPPSLIYPMPSWAQAAPTYNGSTFPLWTPPAGVPSSINSWLRRCPTPSTPGSSIGPGQGISDKYQGNRWAARNQSADIPAEQSTSVWITNLPPDVDYALLLSCIRNVGKIYATVINPPQITHTTSAAKIVFFSVEAKERLLALSRSGQFIVGNFIPLVRLNRIKTAAQPENSAGIGPVSRVLLITGPTSVVSEAFLCDFFRRYCAFDLEYVRHVPLGNGRATMEWAFGSYRCQAERVFAVIRRCMVEAARGIPGAQHVWASVDVQFGRDPCVRDQV
ncbi:hypothetical protein HD806DRAFT_532607 [Xylariaceae sp. AK1471]|nr:hypothetical protein HD806DRAFT_532607 [Xylariaceae sp. AK1471]